MLVTVEDIKRRLRIDGDASDVDLLAMAAQASDIVLGYLKREPGGSSPPDAEEWDDVTVPPRIKAATLLVVRNLHDEVDEPLSQPVKNLLHRDRDPAMA